MGFLKPDMPVVDFDEWVKGTRSEKIRPTGCWATSGVATARLALIRADLS